MKYSAGALLSLFNLDRKGLCPLYRQIYNTIRSSILEGHLQTGTRLPSSRTLASELGISRNTIVLAYEQLQAEGFVTGSIGNGTFISAQLRNSRSGKQHFSKPDTRPHVSRRGKAMLTAYTAETPAGNPLPFVPGIPALDAFPFRLWNRAINNAHKNITTADMNYSCTAGYMPLRQSLASYLAVARGVICKPGQIFIVNGVQHGLDLVCRLLADPGDTVWLEDPGHLGARSVFAANQVRLRPVPVDQQGLIITSAMRRSRNSRLAYVTPSHQSPTGVIMSLERRLELLDWACSRGSWIIEDDYDSEFRYRGQPLAALQGLMEDAPVLYLGTFSKVFAPGLRLAYLVVPEVLIKSFSRARRTVDTHSPLPMQVAMHAFINEGSFSTHIRRMKALYADRQSSFLQAADRHFGDTVCLSASDSGMHLVGYLPRGDDRKLSEAARNAGYMVPALSDYYLDKPRNKALIFGYSSVPADVMDTSVRKLARVLKPLLGRP